MCDQRSAAVTPATGDRRGPRVVLALSGGILGWLVRLWCWTLRVQIVGVVPKGVGPVVTVFFHGHQMALLRLPRRRRTSVLVSLSRDGHIQSSVMRTHGFRVIRGSSSRGGGAALWKILADLHRGFDVALAVDGPRGPLHRAKPGASQAALLTGADIVPVASACSSAWVVRGAWDGFEVPRPFSRVAIGIGEPFQAQPGELGRKATETQICAQRRRAELALASGAKGWKGEHV